MFTEVLQGILTDRGGFAATLREGGQEWMVAGSLLALVVVGGFVHGLTMGIRGGVKGAVSSGVKAPAVPLTALLISLPLLYTVNLVGGVGLSLAQTIALALMPLALTSVLLASAAPLLAFFAGTSGYDFLKLLHVGAFAVCALFALVVLHQALSAFPGGSSRVFLIWTCLYAFVGAQVAWVLRPFIGHPDLPFTFIRRGKGDMNFYTSVLMSVHEIIRTGSMPLAPTQVKSSSPAS